jgi:hypothetical protein
VGEDVDPVEDVILRIPQRTLAYECTLGHHLLWRNLFAHVSLSFEEWLGCPIVENMSLVGNLTLLAY